MKESKSQIFYTAILSKMNNTQLSSKGAFESANSNRLALELEQARDTIIKLKNDLAQRIKEVSLLKVYKQKREDDLLRTTKIVEEIIKQCDRSSIQAMSMISKAIDNNQELPPVNSLIRLSPEQKIRMAEIVQINELKKKINKQSSQLENQKEEIKVLKENQKVPNFIKLNNFMSSYNEYNSIRKENETMKVEYEKVNRESEFQKGQNIDLYKRLKNFSCEYKGYKTRYGEKYKKMESSLMKAKEKEQTCKLFHQRKVSALREKKNKTHDNAFGDEQNTLNNRGEKLLQIEMEMQKLQNKLFEMTNANEESNECLRKMKDDYQAIEKEKNKLKEDNKKLNQKKKGYKIKLDILEQEEKMLKVEISKLQSQVNNRNKSSDEKDKEIRELKQRVALTENENNKLKECTFELSNKMAEYEAKIDEDKAKLDVLQELVEENQNKCDILAQELNEERIKNYQLNEEIEKLNKRIEELLNVSVKLKQDQSMNNNGGFFSTQLRMEEFDFRQKEVNEANSDEDKKNDNNLNIRMVNKEDKEKFIIENKIKEEKLHDDNNSKIDNKEQNKINENKFNQSNNSQENNKGDEIENINKVNEKRNKIVNKDEKQINNKQSTQPICLDKHSDKKSHSDSKSNKAISDKIEKTIKSNKSMHQDKLNLIAEPNENANQLKNEFNLFNQEDNTHSDKDSLNKTKSNKLPIIKENNDSIINKKQTKSNQQLMEKENNEIELRQPMQELKDIIQYKQSEQSKSFTNKDVSNNNGLSLEKSIKPNEKIKQSFKEGEYQNKTMSSISKIYSIKENNRLREQSNDDNNNETEKENLSLSIDKLGKNIQADLSTKSFQGLHKKEELSSSGIEQLEIDLRTKSNNKKCNNSLKKINDSVRKLDKEMIVAQDIELNKSQKENTSKQKIEIKQSSIKSSDKELVKEVGKSINSSNNDKQLKPKTSQENENTIESIKSDLEKRKEENSINKSKEILQQNKHNNNVNTNEAKGESSYILEELKIETKSKKNFENQSKQQNINTQSNVELRQKDSKIIHTESQNKSINKSKTSFKSEFRKENQLRNDLNDNDKTSLHKELKEKEINKPFINILDQIATVQSKAVTDNNINEFNKTHSLKQPQTGNESFKKNKEGSINQSHQEDIKKNNSNKTLSDHKIKDKFEEFSLQSKTLDNNIEIAEPNKGSIEFDLQNKTDNDKLKGEKEIIVKEKESNHSNNNLEKSMQIKDSDSFINNYDDNNKKEYLKSKLDEDLLVNDNQEINSKKNAISNDKESEKNNQSSSKHAKAASNEFDNLSENDLNQLKMVKTENINQTISKEQISNKSILDKNKSNVFENDYDDYYNKRKEVKQESQDNEQLDNYEKIEQQIKKYNKTSRLKKADSIENNMNNELNHNKQSEREQSIINEKLMEKQQRLQFPFKDKDNSRDNNSNGVISSDIDKELNNKIKVAINIDNYNGYEDEFDISNNNDADENQSHSRKSNKEEISNEFLI